ncbi:alpha-amylase [Nitriliruptoraceae bacterium ZYF776]|nr:alpha-amylase [Profundirhabdus halotolerans]
MPSWWDEAVGYQVYIRSFNDADGDGVGDLAGIRAKLPYLADLGVDVVWITPFYPSPQADHGYDVADYTDVEPTFGDLDDARALVADAHALGMKVVVDIVPNHSSDQHPWFQDALTSRDAAHRDFYVWRDGRDGGPPNNWVSNFGGPAWTFHEPTGQWYMHLFLPEQPDLNWDHPPVRDAFDEVLRFWLADVGIDGFRIDVAHSLVEHPEFPDNPLLGEPAPDGADPSTVWESFDHLHDQDRPEVLDIYRRWRAIVEEHDAVLIGEVYLLDAEKVARYVRDDDGLHLAFYFPALRTPWDVDALRGMLEVGVAEGGRRFAYPLSSHDDPHAASRFGGGEVGTRRSLAYATLLCGLPGVPFLYQGDELGLDDGEVEASHHSDPLAVRNPGAVGRDGSRTPMPWDRGDGFGFTTGEPWLPFGANRHDELTAAAQAGRPGSPLERTRALLATRRQLRDLRGDAPLRWLDAGPDVIAFTRGDVLVAVHVGRDGADADAEVSVDAPDAELVHTSGDGASLRDGTLTLPVDTAAYVVLHR